MIIVVNGIFLRISSIKTLYEKAWFLHLYFFIEPIYNYNDFGYKQLDNTFN
jgi:hypothetical protein